MRENGCVNEDTDNLEGAIDPEGRNITQQRMDEAGVEDRPVDVAQPGPGEAGEAEPSVTPEVEFEPDVPLVAEVNRAAADASDRRRKVVFGGLLAGFLVLLRRRFRR
jgi:hypothetical protein